MASINATECPNCGKKGLIQRHDELYQCLVCDFKRDLAEKSSAFDVVRTLTLGFLVVALFRVFLFVDRVREPEPLPEPETQAQIDRASPDLQNRQPLFWGR